jgi:hypothetical protein
MAIQPRECYILDYARRTWASAESPFLQMGEL